MKKEIIVGILIGLLVLVIAYTISRIAPIGGSSVSAPGANVVNKVEPAKTP